MRRLFFFFMLLTMAYSSQSQKLDEKTMKQIVNDLCDCITPHLNKLHPQALKYIKTTAEEGNETASKELELWIKNNDFTEVTALQNSLAYMGEDFQNDLYDCEKKINKKRPDFALNDLSVDDTKRLIKFFKKKSGCKTLADLIELSVMEKKGQQPNTN